MLEYRKLSEKYLSEKYRPVDLPASVFFFETVYVQYRQQLREGAHFFVYHVEKTITVGRNGQINKIKKKLRR